MTNKITFVTIFALVLSSVLFAQIPRIMNYQGKLTDTSGVAVLDTTGFSCAGRIIGFHIYDTSTGGTPLWGETLCVPIINGLFDVVLGKEHPIELDFSEPYYMELVVDNDDDGSISTTADTLLPREKLAPVAFAYRSIYADTADYVSDGASGGAPTVNEVWSSSDLTLSTGWRAVPGLSIDLPSATGLAVITVHIPTMEAPPAMFQRFCFRIYNVTTGAQIGNTQCSALQSGSDYGSKTMTWIYNKTNSGVETIRVDAKKTYSDNSWLRNGGDNGPAHLYYLFW